MDKVVKAHRRQEYSRKAKAIPIVVFLTCYAWFAWQLYIAPWQVMVIIALIPFGALGLAVAHSRTRVFRIAGRHEIP